MKSDSMQTPYMKSDCFGCDCLIESSKNIYCSKRSNPRIKVLPMKGECKEKPSNAQKKLD